MVGSSLLRGLLVVMLGLSVLSPALAKKRVCLGQARDDQRREMALMKVSDVDPKTQEPVVSYEWDITSKDERLATVKMTDKEASLFRHQFDHMLGSVEELGALDNYEHQATREVRLQAFGGNPTRRRAARVLLTLSPSPDATYNVNLEVGSMGRNRNLVESFTAMVDSIDFVKNDGFKP